MKSKPRWQAMKPAWHKQAYFQGNEVSTQPYWHKLRELAKIKMSPEAMLMLEWIIFYHTTGNTNAKATALYFGITRKTLYKWMKRCSKIYIDIMTITSYRGLLKNQIYNHMLCG